MKQLGNRLRALRESIGISQAKFADVIGSTDFAQFRYGDPHDREFQKRLIDTFANAIFVYDDKLVLTYNYQHGTQTITFKEVDFNNRKGIEHG